MKDGGVDGLTITVWLAGAGKAAPLVLQLRVLGPEGYAKTRLARRSEGSAAANIVNMM